MIMIIALIIKPCYLIQTGSTGFSRSFAFPEERQKLKSLFEGVLLVMKAQ